MCGCGLEQSDVVEEFAVVVVKEPRSILAYRLHRGRNDAWITATLERGPRSILLAAISPVHPAKKESCSHVRFDRGVRSNAVKPLHPIKMAQVSLSN